MFEMLLQTRDPRNLALVGACVVQLGCTPVAVEDAAETSTDSQHGGLGDSESGSGSEGEPESRACAEPTTVVGRPRSIAEAVAFINELPRPVTLDCFLERLERPLALNATSSVVSLQPALGSASPRIFLFEDDLIMSVAVDGDPGRFLLEFGELVGEGRSIKAEVAFPVGASLELGDAFERVRDGDGTLCGVCHGGETASDRYPGAFSSDAFAFRDQERVPLEMLMSRWESCDRKAEPERCERLDALLDHGDVREADFPPGLPTIYDYE